MSAAAAVIGLVRASGGQIALIDDTIELEVPASLHEETVAQITANKDAVKRVLEFEAQTLWYSEDYHNYYEERAAIAEHDGDLSREEAELLAYECCVVEWLNQNTNATSPHRCAWCGHTHPFNNVVIPFGTHAHGHTWLHPECWNVWDKDRRRKADQALAEYGLSKKAPQDVTP